MVNVARVERVDVRLADGTVVDSASEAWRAECEARHVLRLPTKMRRYDYLDRVEGKRGKASREALQAAVMALWAQLHGSQDDGDEK
jgi:hypothetical protein